LLNTDTGAVTYRPSTNYNGGDSFMFTVYDGGLYATAPSHSPTGCELQAGKSLPFPNVSAFFGISEI